MAKSKLIHDETWRLLRIIYSREELGNKVLYIVPHDIETEKHLARLYTSILNGGEDELLEFGAGVVLFLFNPQDETAGKLLRQHTRGKRYDVFVHPSIELTESMSQDIKLCAVKQKPEFEVNK